MALFVVVIVAMLILAPPTAGDAHCTLSQNSKRSLQLDCASDHIRFVGIGDWGEATDHAGLLAVRDGIVDLVKQGSGVDFIVAVGDNFYENGVKNVSDSQWSSTWVERFRIGSNLTLPWFALLGNHDHNGNATAQVAYGRTERAGAQYWIMPDAFYSVDVRGSSNQTLKMIMTDTSELTAADLEWVEAETSSKSANWALGLGHFHIHSHGGRGDNKDKPMLQLDALWHKHANVKAYLCGHEHDMQYLRAQDMDYFVFGGGGRKIPGGDKEMPTSAEIVFYELTYGFAVFDVDLVAQNMNVTYHVINLNATSAGSKTFVRNYGLNGSNASTSPPGAANGAGSGAQSRASGGSHANSAVLSLGGAVALILAAVLNV